MTKIRKPMRRRSLQTFKTGLPKKGRKETAAALSENGPAKRFKAKEVAKSKKKDGYRARMDRAEL